MPSDAEEAFRRYLAAIPDELLALVIEDCTWLAAVFAADPPAADYRRRLDLCVAESVRRSIRAA